MEKHSLPVTCPLCGRSTDHPVESLTEGADMVCPHCGVKLNLHGHMWEEIKSEIEKIRSKDPR